MKIVINFWFWNDFRKVAKIVQKVPIHIPLTRVPLMWTAYITTAHLPQLMNSHWYVTINQTPDFTHISLGFSTHVPFLFPGPGNHIIFSHCVSLESSGLWQSLSLPLSLMILTLLRSTVRSFVKYPSIWVYLMFFSSPTGWFVLGKIATEVKFLIITSYQRPVPSTWPITDVDVGPWFRSCLPVFTVVHFLSPFCILYLKTMQ